MTSFAFTAWGIEVAPPYRGRYPMRLEGMTAGLRSVLGARACNDGTVPGRVIEIVAALWFDTDDFDGLTAESIRQALAWVAGAPEERLDALLTVRRLDSMGGQSAREFLFGAEGVARLPGTIDLAP